MRIALPPQARDGTVFRLPHLSLLELICRGPGPREERGFLFAHPRRTPIRQAVSTKGEFALARRGKSAGAGTLACRFVDRVALQSRRRTTVGWVALLLIAVQIVAQAHLLFARSYDLDEFWHLHVGYCMAGGQVPYRDFFEHHGPIAYLMAVPLVWWQDAQLSLLTANRLLSFAFYLLTLGATWGLATSVYGRCARIGALLWLVTMPFFVDKSVEWRPDVPSMFFLTCAAWLAVMRRAAGMHCFCAGVFMALAMLCTPKGLFLCIGVVIGAIACFVARGTPVIKNLVLGVTGFALPWVAVCFWLFCVHALDDFVNCYFGVQARGLLRSIYYVHLLGPVAGAPIHLPLAAASLIIGLVRLRHRRPNRRGESALVIGLLAHIVAIPFVPVVYLQYYTIAMPLLAVLTSGVIVSCTRGSRRLLAHRLRRIWESLPLATCSAAFVLSFLTWFTAFIPVQFKAVDLIAAGMLSFGVLLTVSRPPIAKFTMWLALAVPGIDRVAALHLARNTDQIRTLKLVHTLAKPDQAVLAGSSGVGCLRPNTSYWWCVWSSMIPLVLQEDGANELRSAIAFGVPAVVALDADLRPLLPWIGQELMANYRPVRCQPANHFVLLLRNDLPDETAALMSHAWHKSAGSDAQYTSR